MALENEDFTKPNLLNLIGMVEFAVSRALIWYMKLHLSLNVKVKYFRKTLIGHFELEH